MNTSRKELSRNPFLGAMELAIFMSQGLERFHNNFQSMLKSFLVPLAITPLTFLALYLSHPHQEEIAHIPFSQVSMMFLATGFFKFILTLLILYGFARTYDRLDRLFLTITAANWSLVFPTLLFLPIIISLGIGWHGWDDVYNINIVFALYGYALTAFILTYSLKIPWEMAGFLTICFLAINETGFDFIYWLASL